MGIWFIFYHFPLHTGTFRCKIGNCWRWAHNYFMFFFKESNLHSYMSLRCLYTNADQWANKRDDIEVVILHDKSNIIPITECLTKVQSHNIGMPLLALLDYSLFSSFSSDDGYRALVGSSGVCIHVINGIQASEIMFTRMNILEHVLINTQF